MSKTTTIQRLVTGLRKALNPAEFRNFIGDSRRAEKVIRTRGTMNEGQTPTIELQKIAEPVSQNPLVVAQLPPRFTYDLILRCISPEARKIIMDAKKKVGKLVVKNIYKTEGQIEHKPVYLNDLLPKNIYDFFLKTKIHLKKSKAVKDGGLNKDKCNFYIW